MDFDIKGARDAGYSDDEIADFLAPRMKFNAQAARQAGYGGSDILKFLQASSAPQLPAAEVSGETRRLAARSLADAQTVRPVDPMAEINAEAAVRQAPDMRPAARRGGTLAEMRSVMRNPAQDLRRVDNRMDAERIAETPLLERPYRGDMDPGTAIVQDGRAPWKKIEDARAARPYAEAKPLSDNLPALRQAGNAIKRVVGEDVADTLLIAPEMVATTGKLAADIANLGTMGLAQPVSDWLGQTISAVNSAKSVRYQSKAIELQRLLSDPNAGVADVAGFLASNPRFLAEVGAPSVPSMLIGAGGARIGAALAGKTGAVAGATGANVLMNAGSTFSDTEGDVASKYLAAVPAAAGTALLGRLGGAEAALVAGRGAGIRGVAGVAAREGLQEGGESLSQSLGQGTAEGNFDLGAALKSAAVEGATGALIGGVSSAAAGPASRVPANSEMASAIEASKPPPRPTELRSQHIARIDDFAATLGVKPQLVSLIKSSTEGIPLAELPARTKLIVAKMAEKGLIQAPPEAMALLDEPAMPSTPSGQPMADNSAAEAIPAADLLDDPIDTSAGSVETAAPVEQIQPATSNVDIRAVMQRHGQDGDAMAADLVGQVQAALAEGKSVTRYADGKPVNIVAIDNGMMRDDRGQRWGTLPLLTDPDGKMGNRLEIASGPIQQPGTDETTLQPAAPTAEAPAQAGIDGTAESASVPGTRSAAAIEATGVAGAPINRNWTQFSPESGSLGIPREQMPQIPNRGALVKFLNARGIQHQVEMIPAEALKPTQAEFSPQKVQDYDSTRSIIVSSDGRVLDGHHAWLSALKEGQPVNAIRFDAPIQDLLRLAHQLPSSTTAKGPTRKPADANQPNAADDSASNRRDGVSGTADTRRSAGDAVLQPVRGSLGLDAGQATEQAVSGPSAVVPGAGGRNDALSQPVQGASVAPEGPGGSRAMPAGRVLFRAGRTPNAAVDVEVRDNPDGTVTPFMEGQPLLDYDTGEPITVPAGADELAIKKAIRDAGAVSRQTNFFQVKGQSAQPVAAAPARAPEPKVETTAAVEPVAAAPVAEKPAEVPEEAQKIYRTHKSAKEAARSLGNTMKLQKVAGGYRIRPMTQKEIQAAANFGKAAKTRGPRVESDSLLTAIGRMGGIDRTSASKDLGVHKDSFKAGPVGAPAFREGGMRAENAVENLIELGYLTPGSGLRELEDKIQEELGGNPQYSFQKVYTIEDGGTMEEAAPEFPSDWTEEDIAEARAEREAIMAENDLSQREMNSLRGPDVEQNLADDPTDFFTGLPQSQVTPENLAAAMREMGESEQEIQNAISQRFPGTRGPAEASAAQDRGDGPSGPQASDGAGGEAARAEADEQAEGLTLEAQTAEDLKANAEREAAGEAAAKAKRAAEQAALKKADDAKDNRARADATVDDFQLGQTADEQMSGMGDLFAGDQSGLYDIARSKPRTPEFRAWHEGSKVKGVVYHATANSFDAFDTSTGRSDLGAHFGTLEQANKIASGMRLNNRAGTNIMPVWLSIKNPLRLKDVGTFHADGIAVQLEKKGLLPRGDGKRIEKEIEKNWRLREKYDPMMRKIIEDAGYDGVVYSNTQEGSGDSYIAFEPAQVKSAVGNDGTFDANDPNILSDLSRIGAQLLKQGYEAQPTPVVQPSKRIASLMRRLDKGEITPVYFETAMRGLLRELQEKAAVKEANKLTKERVRGPDFVQEKLLAARRKGDLDDQTVELALWALRKNPALAEDLAISVKSAAEDGTAGQYNPAARIVTLFSGNENEGTALHEILHHTERMMPADVQAAITSEWARRIKEAGDKATADQREAIASMLEAVAGSREAYKKVRKAFSDGVLDYDQHYQLVNPSEFWAVNATRIMQSRFEAGSWQAKAKQWLSEFIEKIKSLLKMPSDAPILKALDAVMRGDGEFLSKRMLTDAKAMDDIAKPSQADIPGTKTPEPAAPTIPPKQRRLDVRQQPTWDMPRNTRLDGWRYKYQDKLVDLKRAERAILAEGRAIEERFDAYLQEELYHGRVVGRTEKFAAEEIRPLVDEMRAAGISMERLSKYLHARHAEEANKLIADRDADTPDGGSGMMTADAKSLLAGQDVTIRGKKIAGFTPEELAALKPISAKVDAIIAETRRLVVSYGLESKSTVDGWAAGFKHYVPLNRDMGDEEAGLFGTGSGFSIRGKETKQRTGSTELDVEDILANVAGQRERIIVRGEKNRVAVALAGLVKQNPNPELWNFEIPPTQRVVNEKTGQVETVEEPNWRRKENVLIVKIPDKQGNVQERAIVFNDKTERGRRLVAGLKNLDAPAMEGILGQIGVATRFLANVNTQYNPIFGMVNLTRDLQGAALNLASTPLNGKQLQVLNESRKLFGRVMAAGFRLDSIKDPATQALWKEFQMEGGQTAFRQMFATTDDRAKAIKKELDPQYWMKEGMFKFVGDNGALKYPALAAQKGTGFVFDWLSDYNDALENVVRLAAYKVAKEQGLSNQRSASLAKNLTVNFNRKGVQTPVIGALYAFFNAAMQGTVRMGEVLFKMEGGDVKTLRMTKMGAAIVGGGVMLGVMQAAALAAAGFEDDEPAEFVRERNLIIPTGDGKYVQIPMPLGWHVLPNIGRIAAETFMKGGKDAGKAVGKIATMFLEAFNPLGGNGPLLQILLPTVADPVAAVIENKDWTGKPITSETFAKQQQPGYLNYKDSAWAVSKFIAQGFNTISGGNQYERGIISPTPDQVQYFIGQLTGGVGRELVKANESAQNWASGEETPWHKIPLVGRFYGDTAESQVQTSRVYALLDAARQDDAVMALIKESGDVAQMDRFLAGNPEAGTLRAATMAANNLKKLRQQKRRIVESGGPRSEVKEIENQMHDVGLTLNAQIKVIREFHDKLAPLYAKRAELREANGSAAEIDALSKQINELLNERSRLSSEALNAAQSKMRRKQQ